MDEKLEQERTFSQYECNQQLKKIDKVIEILNEIADEGREVRFCKTEANILQRIRDELALLIKSIKTGWPLNREMDVALNNFPINPSLIPKECRKCPGEQHYPSCNIRTKMYPELKDPLKFQQLCTPLGGGPFD